MYIIRSLLIWILSLSSLNVFSQDNLPFQEAGKWGLKNSEGQVILVPTYDQIGWSNKKGSFNQNVIGYQKNGFWGLLSSKGKEITNPVYRDLNYQGGTLIVASSLGKISRTTLFGLLDIKGRVVTSFKFLDIQYLKNGLYKVNEAIESENRYGIINPGESPLLPAVFKDIAYLSDDLLLVKSFSNQYGIYNLNGELIIPVIHDQITINSNNQFSLVKDGLIGLSNTDGTIINPVKYKFISESRLQEFPSWSIRNQSNETEELILADSIEPLDKNKYLLFRNDAKVIFNSTSRLSKDFEGKEILEMHDDLVIVKGEKGIQVLKPNGRVLLPDFYDSVYYDNFYLYLKAQSKIEKWTLYSHLGTKLTPYSVDRLLPQSDRRVRFKNDGYWGVLDFDGTIMVQPKFDSVLHYSKNQAIVKKLGLWGLIDNQSQWIILPYEEELIKLSDRLYASKIGYHIKFFSDQGKHLRSITTSYKMLEDFVIIKGESGKVGLMNESGYLLTSIAYDEINRVGKSNFFEVSIGNAKGLISHTDRTVIPLDSNLQEIKGVSESLIAVLLDGKYGFINSYGQLVIANRYDDVKLFSEGLAGYKLNNNWGFLNDRENLVIQPVYDEVFSFNNGNAAVKDDGLWGFINKDGEVLVRLQYTDLQVTNKGRFIVTGENGKGLIDSFGKTLILPIYDDLLDISNEKAIVKKNGKWGVINYNGTYVIPTLNFQIIFNSRMNKYLVREN